MSLNAYEACKIYLGIKMHFTLGTNKFDFIKYGKRGLKLSVDSFMNRRDKFYFERLCKKYSNKEKYIQFLLSNYVSDSKPKWIGDLVSGSADDVFISWQSKIQSFQYEFTNSIKKILENLEAKDDIDFSQKFNHLFECNSDNSYPLIIKMYLCGDVTKEHFIALNIVLKFLPKMNEFYSNDPRWQKIVESIIKYQSFLLEYINKNECEKIIKIEIKKIRDNYNGNQEIR